jgi:uncharacterized protein
MPTRDDPWPTGSPCWIDLSVPDLPGGVAFYRDVLGWELIDSGEEFGHYHIAQVQGRAVAGVGPVMAEGQPAAWTLYFATEDADATAKLVTEHGGALYAGPMDIPGSGRMAVVADPGGAVFGVWQPMGMIGAGIVNESGAMIWEDGRQPDPASARQFYGDVLGWTYDRVEGLPEEFDYRTFSLGDGRPLGGLGPMMGAPEGTPPHWLVFFAVDDVDATLGRVTSGGGTGLSGPEDSPFGRMATVADPFGAVFGLHGPNAGSA